MLIWIKAPPVAVGILTIFLILLGTSASDETNLIPTPATAAPTPLESLLTTAKHENLELHTVRLDQLPFARNILNPCGSDIYSRTPIIQAAGHRTYYAREFYNLLAHYGKKYQQKAQQLLNTTAENLHNCAFQEVNDLPNTPTLEQLQNMTNEEALNSIYSSLTMHSMYSYFIHHQFETSAKRCSEDIRNERHLATSSANLATEQKTLACIIKKAISFLGYTFQENEGLSNETLTSVNVCSRRALRDCQVLRSVNHSLSTIAIYASNITSF
ncbi:uncharacterized protein LOC129218270 isoform X2 [Uloborus diversus]|uniref:uncharacterized protein LOC129218270 isoform X2 n=1 Tax=Uloborus diversus TaxID=327109 RepID=UPI00240A7650|nr:uncharacterized protein LOC129218270 isoform X2 [Uloborus diversus]